MNIETTDRIEKRMLLRAERSKVWHALTDSAAFGTWFGVEMDEPFVPGKRVRGRITHKGYEHLPFDITVEQMDPQRVFSWRWHPHAIETGIAYDEEPTTLVVFQLEEAEGGTMLSVVESGFDGIPLHRRAEAYRGNEEGWSLQLQAIERYVALV